MQSFVHAHFDGLRDGNDQEFCNALMDDIKISSMSLEDHIGHLCLCLTTRSLEDTTTDLAWATVIL